LPEWLRPARPRWRNCIRRSRLGDEAKTALGGKFDIREFHAEVLNTGALPLQVLEEKIHDWIRTKGGTVPAETPIGTTAEKRPGERG
jgi:hypothetical protein